MTIRKKAQVFWDLDEIAAFIGISSPRAALRFLEGFDRAVSSLAAMPASGSLHHPGHPHLHDIRAWPVPGFKKYVIFYRPTRNGIEVLRVLHGARDADTILESGSE
jgi:toxin ParE1/3/4